jgi:hypothetical protein
MERCSLKRDSQRIDNNDHTNDNTNDSNCHVAGMTTFAVASIITGVRMRMSEAVSFVPESLGLFHPRKHESIRKRINKSKHLRRKQRNRRDAVQNRD